MGGLEDLMMGAASESASESDEQFQARLAAAQARMAKIAKDENKAKNFDAHLAKLIPACSSKGLLDLIILMINHDVPSFTTLGVLSLVIPKAKIIVTTELSEKTITDISRTIKLPFGKQAVQYQVTSWLACIHLTDKASTSIYLSGLANDSDFVKALTQYLTALLEAFLGTKEASITPKSIGEFFDTYQKKIFAEV